MGVSENRGPKYSTLNSRILILRTPKEGTLIFGKSHVAAQWPRKSILLLPKTWVPFPEEDGI